MLARHASIALITAATAIGTLAHPLAVAAETVVEITVKKDGEKQANTESPPPFTGKRPAVDVALLLDTSNSMDGLISQAKSQLWKIVNRFADAKKNGLTPVLRVALFEYGNTRLPAEEGYLRQVVPLTDDLDKLSEALFALTTSGGDEYCGQVIDEALKRLDWSEGPGGYQAIFIAGNEPFTQGPVDYRDACKRAIERGVIVNTIHCGNYSTGVSGQWAHGAQLAEGKHLNIDQDRAVERIACPQDEVIIRLSTQLNGTYLWYGKDAYALRANQAAQDSNALNLSKPIAAARAFTKSSASYSNRGRCVVDNFLADESALDKIKEDNLPEVLKPMTPDQRRAHVRKLAARRADLQKQIKKLSAERETFLADARREAAQKTGQATLGDAIVEAIDQQLAKAGYDKK